MQTQTGLTQNLSLVGIGFIPLCHEGSQECHTFIHRDGAWGSAFSSLYILPEDLIADLFIYLFLNLI